MVRIMELSQMAKVLSCERTETETKRACERDNGGQSRIDAPVRNKGGHTEVCAHVQADESLQTLKHLSNSANETSDKVANGADNSSNDTSNKTTETSSRGRCGVEGDHLISKTYEDVGQVDVDLELDL